MLKEFLAIEGLEEIAQKEGQNSSKCRYFKYNGHIIEVCPNQPIHPMEMVKTAKSPCLDLLNEWNTIAKRIKNGVPVAVYQEQLDAILQTKNQLKCKEVFPKIKGFLPH